MIRKDSKTYKIYDWKLPFITLSMTILHPHKKTRGHRHPWRELYFTPPFSFHLYKPNEFHQVVNCRPRNLIFFCIWRNRNRVAVAGGFDPLTIGHLHHIQRARLLGDYLIVIVNRDADMVRKKGYCFMPLEQRMELIEAYLFVDEVVACIDSDGTVTKTLRYLRPDIFAKSSDRTPGNMPQSELDVCEEIGCRIIYRVGDTKVLSSSELVRRASQ